MSIDINNREGIISLLDNLYEHTEAKWGLMKPQNMVEHLVKTLEFSNGKLLLTQKAADEEARKAKEIFIYTDAEMPKGLKSSTMGNVPDPFRLPSLGDAKLKLKQELEDFHQYFENNSNATFIHPRLGSLNYKEWIILHNKHFTHHFKQFGLL